MVSAVAMPLSSLLHGVAVGKSAEQGSATVSKDTKPVSPEEVGFLLAKARTAMSQGQLQDAEILLRQAEGANVRYPLLHFGDTPPKVRRDLEKLRSTKRSDAKSSKPTGLGALKFNPLAKLTESKSKTKADPFLTQASHHSPATSGNAKALPASIAPAASAPSSNDARLASSSEVPAEMPLPLPGSSLPSSMKVLGGDNPFRTSAAKGQTPPEQTQVANALGSAIAAGARTVGQTNPTGSRYPTTPSADATSVRQQSDEALLAARRALVMGDVVTAQRHLDVAKQLPISHEGSSDSPAKLAEAIAEYQRFSNDKNNPAASAAWRHAYARFLLNQAAVLIEWKDLETAERAATEAAQMRVPLEAGAKTPHDLLQQIRSLRSANRYGVVPASANLPIPDPFAGHDAPQTSEATTLPPTSSVLPTAPLPVSSTPEAVHAPADSPSEPRVAQAVEGIPMPLPALEPEEVAPVESPAYSLLHQGEEALRRGDRQKALELFRQAYNHPDKLDIESQQQLQDHLQMLATAPAAGTPSAGSAPAGGRDSYLLDTAGSGQAVLARQVSADVGRLQSEAARLREQDPSRSLAILRDARDQVEKSGLDEGLKSQLLRRVELSLVETEKYIEDHRSELELDAQNREVLDEIERHRNVKAQLRERIAESVDQFNTLRDEQRYAEMEVVAKRLYDMAPEEPVAQQVWENAKFIRRSMLNRELKDRAEQGVYDMLAGVQESKIVTNPDDPYQFSKSFSDLIKSRKGASDGGHQLTPRELEIQRKLRTPVLPNYQDAPLSQVIDGLSDLVGINIHLDPRGLSQEGIPYDTPINLELKQEISLESALTLILEPLHLTYIVKDEVLKITSLEISDGELIERVYNVADLVIPIPNFMPTANMGLQGRIYDAYNAMGYGAHGVSGLGPAAMVVNNQSGQPGANPDSHVLAQQFGAGAGAGNLGGMGQSMSGGPGGMGGGANADFDSLIELITSTVEHDSWMENGTGQGEIQPFPTNLSLVISQTQKVHEKIADLLEQLRSLQDLQVTIEVRFIRLTDSFFERIGVDFDFNIEDGTNIPFTGDESLPPGASFEPPRASASVGLDKNTSESDFPRFHADLDIPFRNGSFGLTAPQFGTPQDVATFGFAILSDIEAYFLIEAAQGDQRSNLLNAPKVTLFNGQYATIQGRCLRAVRYQRNSGGRRICRRLSTGDRRPLRGHDALGASGGVGESALRSADAGAVLQSDWRCPGVHLRRFRDVDQFFVERQHRRG